MDVALLIVGGGPAALAAARGYRAAGGTGAVMIVADEHRLPYRRPPLTKDLVRGVADKATLSFEPEAWYREQDVVVARTRVTRLTCAPVDPSLAAVEQLASSEDRPASPPAASGGRHAWLEDGRVVAWVALVLATGSAPGRTEISGVDLPGVHTVRTVADVDALLARLGTRRPVAVIGSGFIGCEIAASLRMRGHPVTVVSDEPQPLAARLGDEAAARIAGWLRADGVHLQLGAAVERIEASAQSAELLEVVTSQGSVTAHTVVLAIGARPRLELARDLGLDVSSGGIKVDGSMRTALPGVFAAGDVAIAHHMVAGRPIRTEHWGDALTQGEVAGRTAAGRSDATWKAVPGFWSTIGTHTVKYAAWGDGFDDAELIEGGNGGFVVTYRRDGQIVGVLAHDDDAAYERGSDELLAVTQTTRA